MAKKETILFEFETGGSVQSIKELTKGLRQAKSAMLEAEEGTEHYEKALAFAAETSHRLSEVNRIVKASAADLGVVLENTTQVLGGIAGGISAVNGVVALFGVENEKVAQTLVRLQAGMAVVQGLNGLDGMVKGFQSLTTIMKTNVIGLKVLTGVQKVYNFVMSMNPIFIIVAVLAAVIAGILALSKALGKNNEVQKTNNELLEDEIKLRDKLNEAVDFRIKMMKAEGKSDFEIFKAKILYNNKNLKDAKDTEEDLRKLWQNSRGKEKKANREAYDNAIKEREKYTAKGKELEQEVQLYYAAQRTKEGEDFKKKEAEKLEELINTNIKRREIALKWEEFSRTIGATAIADAEKAEADKNAKLAEQRAFAEGQFKQSEDDLMAQFELMDMETEAVLAQNQIIVDGIQNKIDIREIEKQHAIASVFAISDALGAAADLAGRDSKLGKALAISSTIISTIMSARLAFQSAFSPIATVYSPILGAASAAAATMGGLAAIKQIRATKVPAVKGGGGGGGAMPSMPAPPPITSGVTFSQTVGTTDVKLQDTAPIKAYVVETEITSVQGKVKNTQDEASF